MSDSSPFVSVVAPIYNTEPYLEQCIRSVLSQTHQNFELVLVENQSTDHSAAIAADYVRTDPRIKLIRTPKFFAQIDNLNFTLSQISERSRYAKMVLSDDWIFPSCLTEMVALAEENPRVSLVGCYRLVEEKGDGFGLPVEQRAIPGRDACRLHLLNGIFLFGTPTTVMYRSDVVRARKPFFRPDRIFVDTDAVFDILRDHDFGFAHQVLAFCRGERAGSIKAADRKRYPVALDRYVLLKNHGRSYLNEDEYRRCLAGAERYLYDGLARAWLARPLEYPNGPFWKYQHEGLATAQEVLKPARLARAIARVVGKSLASPLDAAKLLRGLLPQ
jgi:glycosyltransferase involved in cell wall biosynthesis